ncbi:cupin domain-containing protein [Beijerinckia indica]|uniref:Cupin 2 conserved barrel domain protein n=1 Tax=Beijerinckia indica subsp. indica (strain ATCC 9039 / DSM 1715 / NCIMB 8712) TaxID=395963 RepID=B2IKX3_BEII9|nr:cupin domain-containing protein [Beijerinckia indica]ACB96513.1 Cupin 2 conserved barrel domain protein [Beijerinckia indica subsp. indica ATCC 9039]
MTKPILNIADVDLQPRPPQYAPTGAAAEIIDARVAFVSRQFGTSKLAYNVTAIPPGKRAFPFHNHQTNDEMFLILSGNGEIRIGQDSHAIRPGDIISCPAGGPETAHQMVNTGSEELRFLAVSSMYSPDIVEYPDSGRFGILADFAPTPDGQPRRLMYVGRENDSLPYWDS